MTKNAVVRNEVFLIDPLEHPSLCLGSQNSMMRKTNISEIINAAGVRFEDYFLWMHLKTQLFAQKDLDFFKTTHQQFFVGMDKNKIVGISDIAGDFEFVLNELIQLVQIHVGKQLGGQIAQRQAGRETLNYFPEKRHQSFVGSPFFENIQKNPVINGIKKFSHIQLQNPQRPGVISRQFQPDILQSFNGSVDAFCFSGRPRVKNKNLVPYRLNDPVDGMMNQTIAHRSFVNMAAFWIVDIKRFISSMLI